jgi:hypothetical protein
MIPSRLNYGTVAVQLLALVLTGCGTLSPGVIALSNPKVVRGQLAQLTVDEILTLNSAVVSAVPQEPVPILTRAEAEALHAFFVANNLNSQTELQAFDELARNTPSAIPGLFDLATAFAGTPDAFNASQPTTNNIEEILETIFGGGIATNLLPPIFLGDGRF